MIPLKPKPGMTSILELTPAALGQWLGAHGWPAWRARQIRRRILAGRGVDFAAMSELPVELRRRLSEDFAVLGSAVAMAQKARDGTEKLLVRLGDGEQVECVMIPELDRRTACISTQVGCGMGCVFCASGLNGVTRNLRAAEILEQLVLLRNRLPERERLSNIVVMGMGEPLANLDALIEALDAAGSKDGLGIGARHVTISTVGLPAKIRRLADLEKQYHLAVSLHAPNDPLRTQIVPTNRQTGLAEILDAAEYFFNKTGRQVTFEYVLLGGINDQAEHARELARLLRGRRAHVNLIPFNDVEGLPYCRPSQESLAAFTAALRRGGQTVKVRKRKGSEIAAACGQLRRQEEAKPLAQAEV